jgi:hypothetical protein
MLHPHAPTCSQVRLAPGWTQAAVDVCHWPGLQESRGHASLVPQGTALEPHAAQTCMTTTACGWLLMLHTTFDPLPRCLPAPPGHALLHGLLHSAVQL